MSHGEHMLIHADQEKKRKAQEEEEMTGYTDRELSDDWEFKIVRSATGQFKKPETVAQVREEEALLGWQLVEKFDNNRMRFKRLTSAQERDLELAPYMDPYRTQYGISEGGLAVSIISAIILIGGTLAFIATYFNW